MTLPIMQMRSGCTAAEQVLTGAVSVKAMTQRERDLVAARLRAAAAFLDYIDALPADDKEAMREIIRRNGGVG